ncbi:type III pantothenate kinase [Polaribacter porphyrae]|uniref:Type III pantothenate kinase n=1 Tax=Polaribacter porphyrae TaxID=1137780 RepID=A0A2S7WMR9_9FLAO|nr:type III pantothenate kinase [Polaribacter porphyrae]PQJ78900.1 pantothenate kinase [Polaribacter porphyrae]
MNLVVDVGNTRVKAAVFNQKKIKKIFVFKKNRILSEVKKILSEFKIEASVICSVSSLSSKKKEKLKVLLDFLEVTSRTKVQFNNLYATPNTLGVDRIALVSASINKFPNKNVLIIDAGTCITYDFISSNKDYLGGAISPGIEMRFKSLHHFTSKLPLLSAKNLDHFTGNSTPTSINSGVINGVLQEIEGVINQYRSEFLDLTVVLTGGDTNFLSKQLKSSIFANQNFLLEGLNEILILTKTND